MISKCPECGRSYPSHHGSICKLCVAKSNSPAATVAVKSSEPVMAASVPAVVEKKADEPVISPSGSKIMHQMQDQGQVFNPFLGINTETAPDNSSPAAESSSSDSAQRICPYCERENDPSDVFCRQCEKMIIRSSDGKKLVDYQLTDLKGTIPDQLAKLKKIGIMTSLQLLDKGSSPTKRKTLSIKTGISETFLQRLVHQADLLRLNSVQPEQAFLLECIGINTIKLLERKVAKEIIAIMAKQKIMLQSKKILVLPGEKIVTQWLSDIKDIEKVVT